MSGNIEKHLNKILLTSGTKGLYNLHGNTPEHKGDTVIDFVFRKTSNCP